MPDPDKGGDQNFIFAALNILLTFRAAED